MFPKARKEAKRKVIEHPKQNTSVAQGWFSLCPAMSGSASQITHFRAGRTLSPYDPRKDRALSPLNEECGLAVQLLLSLGVGAGYR